MITVVFIVVIYTKAREKVEWKQELDLHNIFISMQNTRIYSKTQSLRQATSDECSALWAQSTLSPGYENNN